LRGLRGVEVVAGFDEASARVRHRRAEEQAVEVVRHVVVVADRRRVAPLGVQPASEPDLLRRRRQRPPDHTQLEGGPPRREQRLQRFRGFRCHVKSIAPSDQASRWLPLLLLLPLLALWPAPARAPVPVPNPSAGPGGAAAGSARTPTTCGASAWSGPAC